MDYILYRDYLSGLKEAFLVLNSSISEGMSSSILEAMALGVPVLVRNNKGNLSFVKEGENGLVFSCKEDFELQYRRLIEEKGLRERLIENGRITFSENGPEREGLAYQRVLGKVLKEKYMEECFFGRKLQLLRNNKVHGVSSENLELFNVKFINIGFFTLYNFLLKNNRVWISS